VVRIAALVLCAVLLPTGIAAAQPESPASDPWSYYASAYLYFIEDEDDYAQPTIAADRDWLHLEARYNYEDRDTGSAWVGYNLSAGDELLLEFTPMLGVVFGNTSGIAPGFKGSLNWRNLALSSETQYVLDADDPDSSFLYTWSELTFAPNDAWRAGLVVQRTKVYETEFDIQRGLLVGFAHGRLDLTAYVFNPDESPTVVLAVGASF
jgi:hypothetical protein